MSAGGKYCSLCLEVTVVDEEARLAIGRDLIEHPDVRMVI
jgi:putative lipoic acid-binding regulatory protein